MTKVLSQESVDHLKQIVRNGIDIRARGFERLVEEENLRLLDVEYRVDPKHRQLVMPTGTAQSENGDTVNCIQIGNYLPTLTAAEATDERLWVTLCFREFNNYVGARWIKPDSVDTGQHIMNHWFASDLRGRMRNNGIGRLWWYQHFCSKIPNKSLTEVFEILFENSEYRSAILERPSSASHVNVTSAILEITTDAIQKDVVFNREKFRIFMKNVSFVGARSSLGALDVDTIKEILAPLYWQAYD